MQAIQDNDGDYVVDLLESRVDPNVADDVSQQLSYYPCDWHIFSSHPSHRKRVHSLE